MSGREIPCQYVAPKIAQFPTGKNYSEPTQDCEELSFCVENIRELSYLTVLFGNFGAKFDSYGSKY